MNRSRRMFLKSLSALPIGASLPSLASMNQLTSTKGATSLAVSFSGPLAFVMEEDDVTVYAPQLPNHFGRVSTSDGEVKLRPSATYRLSGLPSPSGETQRSADPLTVKATKTPSAPTEFAIRVKRPDAIVGIKPVDAFLSNEPDRKRSLPTGLRFLYKNVSPDLSLQLSANDGFNYQPTFAADRAADPLHLSMEFEFETPIADHCHTEARASFETLLKLFPEHGITSIHFADEDPSCATNMASAHLEPAIYQQDGLTAHKLNVATRSGSCMAPVLLILVSLLS
jgi:hypothetical protein